MSILPIRRISAASRSLLTLRFSATRRVSGGKVTALLACALLCFGALPAAHAATINVDSGCTLAQAITSANTDATAPNSTCEAGSGADTITLSANVNLSALLPAITSDITIDGKNYTIDGRNSYRVLDITAGTVTIQDAVLTKGNAGGAHGGIIRSRGANLTLTRVTLSNGESKNNGGGLFFDATSKRLTITSSIIAGNETKDNSGGLGGGIYVRAQSATIKRSAIGGNSGYSHGGGIYNDGSLTIENSTFYSNQSTTGHGGGVYTNSGDTTTLKHVTLNGNTVSSSGDGDSIYRGGTTNLYNSILAGSDTSAHCEGSGTLNQAGSLIQDNSCSPAVSGDPSLGTLTGSPAYYPLSGSSIAVDTAVSTHCLRIDQVGTSRAQGSACDIGAFEVLAANIIPSVTPTPAPTNTPIATLTPTPTDTPTLTPTLTTTPLATNTPTLTPTITNTPLVTNTPAPTSAATATSVNNLAETQAAIRAAEAKASAKETRAYIKNYQATRTRRAIQRETATARVLQPSSAELLNDQGYAISARYGLRSGVQIMRVNARGVGNQQVLDMGMLDALDVWGYVEQGVEVCFPQSGKLMFLDAATSPRTLMSIDHYWKAGRTCAYTNRAGTVVLLAGAGPAPIATATPWQQQPLRDCKVTLLYALNFRETPGGNIIMVLPAFVTLTVFDKVPGWYRVDYYGQKGWISAGYVETQGSC